ncbi:putative quinol monooxygenase [Pontivivens insulae]|uniref:(4S)-4-hydroxy-5-phosphonooxypentane-2,3-dione isomerase n=1 Tax=Pontivivens insulae TaxID=1639689 RepID=A0A2R8AFS4_9RHOB|nr:putative quinol monooxygenase [Pontivivens insulae]RED12174.1 quinol monooxygenase YgiN [Pontivivens insulae]SPF30930.1 (4S)-4-hydroxy-5-phosphonooxypentane-2,3-dione isomerase [Pontivivens insulae]
MFAVVVTFEIEQERMEEFLPAMQANARQSLAQEPGCHQFDVCTDPSRPAEVFLYELYSDAAAFAEHLDSAHFKTFDRVVAPMIRAKTVSTYSKVVQ